ncbi:MAG: argininosuccinate lyase [Bacteroidetes bacterium]|nr:argininosuccinate lyase [Bacteroidota bacterium]
MKLWQKNNTHTAALVEQFTVGRDKEFDLLLAKYDIIGSIAHVTMLGEVGIMAKEEAQLAVDGLNKILTIAKDGKFIIEEGIEDVHSQVEKMLTDLIGAAGKKIHSGRSRNDQVATDIKLYLRAEVNEIKALVFVLFDTLIEKSEANKHKLFPGYTHLQAAMPSSAGLWLSAHAEGLIDDLELLSNAYQICNKNPLGSGAGYGSSFPLNRKRTTELLHFKTLHWNSIYAQMSRGKTERFVGMALAALGATISRFSMDCCLYMNDQFRFISLPDTWTTGSSLMPHKKNPDVFELLRAKGNRMQSVPNELALMLGNLPSGYHRDVQLTKEILFPAVEEMKNCLRVMTEAIQLMEIKDGLLEDKKYDLLFSVEALNQLVNDGVAFRDAYQIVGNQIQEGSFIFKREMLHHTHEGSIGNLCLQEIRKEMEKVKIKFE